MHDLKVAITGVPLDRAKNIIAIGNRDDLLHMLWIPVGVKLRGVVRIYYQGIAVAKHKPLQSTDNHAPQPAGPSVWIKKPDVTEVDDQRSPGESLHDRATYP